MWVNMKLKIYYGQFPKNLYRMYYLKIINQLLEHMLVRNEFLIIYTYFNDFNSTFVLLISR